MRSNADVWARIALVVVFASCAREAVKPDAPRAAAVDLFHDLLITPDECKRPSAAQVTRDQAKDDLKQLQRILEYGYAGYEVLERQGLKWADIFRDAAAAVDAMPEPMASETFRHLLLKHFAITNDRHLAFWTVDATGTWQWNTVAGHRDAYVAGITLQGSRNGPFRVSASNEAAVPVGSMLLDCGADQLAALLKPTVSSELPTLAWLLVRIADKTPAPLSCRFETGGKAVTLPLALRRIELGEKKRFDPLAFEKSTEGVLKLRVRSFGSEYSSQLDAFVASAAEARQAKAVLIDARGNGGGSDSYVMEWFKALTTGSLLYSVIERKQSDVTLQGDANRFACQLGSRKIDAAARARLQDSLKRAVEDVDANARDPGHAYIDWSKYGPADEGTAPAPFLGALVLLLDRHCASSCETLVQYARQVPGAVTLGENTAGMGMFGEVRPYRLPHSGIMTQAGYKWFHSVDSRLESREGTGYLPDIWLADSESAEVAAISIATCLSREACGKALRAGLTQ